MLCKTITGVSKCTVCVYENVMYDDYRGLVHENVLYNDYSARVKRNVVQDDYRGLAVGRRVAPCCL